MKSGVICVFDRMNEGSLMAAAVLKKFGQFQIVHVDKIDKITIDPSQDIHWLGIQPVSMVAFKLSANKHYILKPGCDEKPVARNVFFLADRPAASEEAFSVDREDEKPYVTITEQAFHLLLKPDYMRRIREEKKRQRELEETTDFDFMVSHFNEPIPDFPEEMKHIEPWIGAAYIVEQFQRKETDKETVARGWQILKTAYHHVLFDHPLEIAEVDDEVLQKEYLDAVADSKKLIGHLGQTGFAERKGKLTATLTIAVTDHHMYVMKRLINMAGMGWKSPVVLLDELYYNSNKAQQLAA